MFAYDFILIENEKWNKTETKTNNINNKTSLKNQQQKREKIRIEIKEWKKQKQDTA